MAIKRLSTSETKKENLPFLNAYLNNLSKKELDAALKGYFFVEKLLPVKSGKGTILSTKEFSVFIWKGSKEETFLYDPMKELGKPPAFFVFPISKDGKFEIAYDDEIEVEMSELPNGGFSFLQIAF